MHVEEQISLFHEKQMATILRGWERFYEKVFLLKKDFSNLHIPEKECGRDGFDRLIVVAEGMYFGTIINYIRKGGHQVSLYPDVLSYIDSPRVPTHDYAIWARNGIECDALLRGLSRDDLMHRGIATETAEERLLHGMKILRESSHTQLDKAFYTLTSSCDRYGKPIVIHFCANDGVKISWFGSKCRRSSLGAREVIL